MAVELAEDLAAASLMAMEEVVCPVQGELKPCLQEQAPEEAADKGARGEEETTDMEERSGYWCIVKKWAGRQAKCEMQCLCDLKIKSQWIALLCS
jgi:hypothetical protein